MSLFEHLAGEPFARQMGIAIDEIRPGYARASGKQLAALHARVYRLERPVATEE